MDAQHNETFAEAQTNKKCIVKDNQYREVNFILHYADYFSTTALTNRNHYFGLKHLDAGVADQAVKTKLEEPEWKTDQPALTGLLVCASVADGVKNSRHNPSSTKNAGSHRELQASNEKGSDEASLVLEVVATKIMSACVLLQSWFVQGFSSKGSRQAREIWPCSSGASRP